MKVARDTVVSIDYTLRNEAGAVIDQSGDAPLVYLHGHGNIVPGLETHLAGLEIGAQVKATVSPAEGYGERSEQALVEVSRQQLPEGMEPEVGMMLSGQAPDGQPVPFWVAKVEEESVILDGNHPLAGQTLVFEVEVRDVRAASEEELERGQVDASGASAD
ncbi:MAG: peptidylprolyl isomerase [Myxococcota bacterium]